MITNLKIYLTKNKIFTKELKKLIKLCIISQPYFNITNKINILNLLELSSLAINYNSDIDDSNNLIKAEDIIPSKLEAITKIIGFKIETLYNLKLNQSRLTLKYKKTINIYWLELIGSYRGWRHMHGLPVRGQRTWTNAWSAYKSNLNLREFIVTLTKNIYKVSPNVNNSNLKLAYTAEHINKLWSVQWELEWKKARKKRIEAIKKNYKNYTIDLVRLASGNVNSKKVRKNRKKQAEEKKNIFYLGFDKGFTKYLLENNKLEIESIKKKRIKKKTSLMKKSENLKLLVLLNLDFKKTIKKKPVSKQKKAELQAKKRKNILLKKKKKSVWD